ncbi:MAG TPA: c-type cytochrome [Acidobacteriota bacterium]|nr:c-type cytochrome [Acidobacteriota bacterium]
MERIEKTVFYIAVLLMLVFTGLILYAASGLGISLPTCNDNLVPFTEGKLISKTNNQFEIHYVARMWSFEPAELILPENAEVDLYLSALDVEHGFQIPGTNLNLMATPGSVNSARHKFNKKGEYLVICHEYCGLNHHNMMGKIKVVTAEDYARIQQEQASITLSAAQKLMDEKQCSACHSIDGSESLGPTFKGLYGSTRELTDESEVIADETYLTDAIKSPDKHIVEHFEPGSMPPPDSPLTDDEIKQLVEYIKSLK